MKVKMLTSTGIPGGYARVGEVVDVDDATAGRWLDHRIAVFVNAEPDELTNADVDELPTSEMIEDKKSAVPQQKKVGRPKKGK